MTHKSPITREVKPGEVDVLAQKEEARRSDSVKVAAGHALIGKGKHYGEGSRVPVDAFGKAADIDRLVKRGVLTRG